MFTIVLWNDDANKTLCGIIKRRKPGNIVPSRGYCHRAATNSHSSALWPGIESRFIEWMNAIISITSQYHNTILDASKLRMAKIILWYNYLHIVN